MNKVLQGRLGPRFYSLLVAVQAEELLPRIENSRVKKKTSRGNLQLRDNEKKTLINLVED